MVKQYCSVAGMVNFDGRCRYLFSPWRIVSLIVWLVLAAVSEVDIIKLIGVT